MPFKYIIPNKHREEAIRQKRNTIKCHRLGWHCPITIVDIGESIMYILNNDDLDD